MKREIPLSLRTILYSLVLSGAGLALAACGDSQAGTTTSTSSTGSTTSTTSTSTTTSTATSTATAATLAFAQTSYSVNQSAGTIQISVVRSGGTTNEVSVEYTTGGGTAVAGTDYTTASGGLYWAAGDSASKSIVVPISTAAGFNGTKTLQVTLSSPSSMAVLGTASVATITIQGSGGTSTTTPPSSGSIAISGATYGVSQSAGAVKITVARTNGSAGAVSVAYATADGTAKAGTDYTAASGTLTWADGDTALKTVSVAVSNSTPFTGSKTFALGISGATGGATLGSPTTSTVTIAGTGVVGTLSLASSTYTVVRSAGALTVTASRTEGTTGAVSVKYATANGTAIAGTDYTAVSGTLSWASGDNSTKSFQVPVNRSATSNGTAKFSIALSQATGGAQLGTPSTATAVITAATAPGSIALGASSFNVAQAATSLSITAVRTGGTSGAVTVSYATADGTAHSGTDYTAASGTLSWAAGDATAKTFSVAILNPTAYSGTRAFTVTLAGATGGATLATPSSATVTITGSSTTCAQSSSSWTTTGVYTSKDYGNYIVNNNNWGSLPGQQLWVNSPDCWGVTTTATTDVGSIRSYPSTTRGWTQNDTMMLALSTPGTNDWTTKSGMGIAVTQLTKAKTHWSFTAPTTGGVRWMGLMDIYFHQSPTPDYSAWPPYIDLMIDQSLADQVVNSTTYYALVATESHATTVTLGGNKYLVYIDNPGEASYHQAAGHDIHLFQLPTSSTSNNANPNWGVQNAVTDVAAIIAYFMQSNPVDDAGKPLMNASGTVITSPLISSSLYLNAINAGWEIDTGTAFTNTGFCVAMQNEPDCP